MFPYFTVVDRKYHQSAGEEPIPYNVYQYFVQQGAELLELWQAQRQNSHRLADVFTTKREIPTLGPIVIKTECPNPDP